MHIMPPGGRKRGGSNRQPTEVPTTEYERLRAEEIMRNNRELQRLGINTLVSIVNNASVKRKGEDREVSGSLYTGEESEDYEEVEVSKVAKVAHTKNPTSSGNISVRGAQASKRVVAQAPQEQHVPARMTRQKTRDLAPALSPDPQEVLNLGLSNATPTHDPSQQQDLVGITDEGARASG